MAGRKKKTFRERLASVWQSVSAGVGAVNTQDVKASDAKEKFRALLDAFEQDRPLEIDAFTRSLDEIRQYVVTISEEEEKIIKENLGDKYESLILFLSTPQSPEPLDWDSEKANVPDATRKGRKRKIILMSSLWANWQDKRTIPRELKKVFVKSGFPSAEADAWVSNAQSWFEHFSLNKQITSQQTRLDVVGGYRTLVDRLLLKQKNLAEAHVFVLGHEHPPVLQLPSGTRVSIHDITPAIEFRSGVSREEALDFAIAISLSLPVHTEILSTIDVEVSNRGLLLKSNWKDPLSR